MEINVIRSFYEDYGHMGIKETSEVLLRTFWFPNMREKLKILC